MARWLFACVVLMAACTRDDDAKPVVPKDTELAWHRTVMTGADASEVAFMLGVPRGKGAVAVVVSGTERGIGKVKREGDALRVEFPLYFSSLVLTPVAGGAGYTGRYEITSPSWGDGQIPLRATPAAAPTIAEQATLSATAGAPLDLREPRTVWRMQLGELTTKLVLDQRAPGEISATMYMDHGNVVYFSGSARGDRVLLAGFEGASPFSLDLTLDAERKTAKGMWRAGHVLSWREEITGARVADFDLAPKIAVESKTAVLLHPLLKGTEGKPLIVELAATWCGTCKRVAPVLRGIYKQQHGRGLQMVSLLYEMTSDPAENKELEKLFRESHEVSWPVHAVSGAAEDVADTLPSGLNNVDVGGFPVVIFRRKDGTIAGVQSGFPAESTGAPHQAVVEKFRRLTAEIMAP